MPLDYSQRSIAFVSIPGFSRGPQATDNSVGVHVSIGLKGPSGEARGPIISLNFGFPATRQSSFQELEHEALGCAAALLDRLSRETAESLLKTFEKQPEADEGA